MPSTTNSLLILTLKLVLTPTLIGGASLAGRRWGPAVSGWLVGLPVTSAPITFFLALNHGASFARAAALGTLAAAVTQAAYCLTYSWAARRAAWPAALLAGFGAYAAATLALQALPLALAPVAAAVLLTLLAALALMPARVRQLPPASALPAWDLPARMLTATLFVLALTDLAARLGPQLTGLLAAFPIYASTLVVFAQHQRGPAAAAEVLRGLLLGLFAFTAFYVTLAALIEIQLGLAYLAAAAAALSVQAGSGLLMRRGA